MIRWQDKLCRTESQPSKQSWRAQNWAGHLGFQVRNSRLQCLTKSLLLQTPAEWHNSYTQSSPRAEGNLPSPLSAHTGHRKQSNVSFPGCFCSYSVYCDGHIMIFLLIEWCYCANQVPIDVLSFLVRLRTGCCQEATVGTGGWHGAISFHTARFFLWKLHFSQKNEMIFDILRIIGKEMERREQCVL